MGRAAISSVFKIKLRWWYFALIGSMAALLLTPDLIQLELLELFLLGYPSHVYFVLIVFPFTEWLESVGFQYSKNIFGIMATFGVPVFYISYFFLLGYLAEVGTNLILRFKRRVG